MASTFDVLQDGGRDGFGHRTGPREEHVDVRARLDQSGDGADVGDLHRYGAIAGLDGGGYAFRRSSRPRASTASDGSLTLTG